MLIDSSDSDAPNNNNCRKALRFTLVYYTTVQLPLKRWERPKVLRERSMLSAKKEGHLWNTLPEYAIIMPIRTSKTKQLVCKA